MNGIPFYKRLSQTPFPDTENKYVTVDGETYFFDEPEDHWKVITEAMNLGMDVQDWGYHDPESDYWESSKVEEDNTDEEGNWVWGSILSPVHETRDTKIWDGEDLNPDVRAFCVEFTIDYLSDFFPKEDVELELIKHLYLIGSITGYQYDPDADLDVNVLVDLDLLSEALGLDKELLIYEMRGRVGEVNGELYPGTEHPVNIFLATEEGYPPADGIYDLITDEWIKKPGEPKDLSWDPYANLKDAIDRAEEIAGKVDAKWGALWRTYAEVGRYEGSRLQLQRQCMRYLKSMKRILKNVVEERRESFDLARKLDQDPPQAGTPNVVYKYLEYNGILDKLHDVSHMLHDIEETGVFELVSSIPKTSQNALRATRISSEGFESAFRVGIPQNHTEA